MPQAVVLIATEISALATNAALAAGASSATAEAVSSIVYTAAAIGVSGAAVYGLGAALAPKLPDPQALLFPLKQSMPVRQSAFGRVRVAGAYALYTVGSAHPNFSYDVLALLDGQSNAYVSTYLNDDLMAAYGNGYWWAPGATGKYGGGGSNPPNLVQLDWRLGLTTETAYTLSDVPVWDSNHRGDGVTSLLLTCIQAKREDQAGDFPNGLPQPTAVIDSQLIFDPRDGTQTQGTSSTYKFSDNPILCLLAYLTDASGGMGLDYGRFLEPAISFWTAAATACDATVTTSGMHATLLDAANSGDHKIFLADQTGLTVGSTIQLATETVTVSAIAGAGEVDLTTGLRYNHPEGELEYWNATGVSSAFRCAGTYKHDSPPGDVIKQILASFDGWLGQRGDGSLVVRTNALYAPTVVLTDVHFVGLQLQNFVPDEQATNQFIVSYTDPASAFNKQEAGYVEDDADIAVRGDKPQELYLQWVPSAPQAIAVARAMLARATQQLRGTLTCNLAGLAALGERYIGVQISAIPDLNDIVVEVTGRPVIDLKKMTVSIPFVAASPYSGSGPQAICFIIDTSGTTNDPLPYVKAGVAEALAQIGAAFGATLDIGVVAGGNSGTFTSIVRRSASASDIDDIETWVNALAYQTGPTPTLNGFDASAAMTEAQTAFFDGTSSGITARRIVLLWDGVSDPGGVDPPALTTIEAAQATLQAMPGVLCNVIVIDWAFGSTLTQSEYLDNTPDDGIPISINETQVVSSIQRAIFGSSSTSGASYTLPTLTAPSGAPLQTLAAPTISSVTANYPSSGGGVAGANLTIVVADPGVNAQWKVQWKLSTDTDWTLAATSLDASGTPPQFVTGLIAATGTIDVQVAYITATQVSPWSATSTVTVAAPPGGVASTSVSTSFTTTSANNVYYVDTSSGAVTATLNATPALNEVAEIWDSTGHAATNPISFAGNGNTIAGSATVSNFIQTNFGHARLMFDGTQWLMQ